MGFIAGIGLGFLSTRLAPSQSSSQKVNLQNPTLPPAPTTPPPPTPPIATALPGLPPEYELVTPQNTLAPVLDAGKLAPDFSLKTLDGQTVNLAEFAGKPILINVWATWCPPCRDEMSTIQAAYEKYKNKGLVVLGINFTVQDSRQDVATFVNDLKLTFPILMDESGDVSAGLYGVHALPESFFVNTSGMIQRTLFGAMLPAELEGYLAEILPQ